MNIIYISLSLQDWSPARSPTPPAPCPHPRLGAVPGSASRVNSERQRGRAGGGVGGAPTVSLRRGSHLAATQTSLRRLKIRRQDGEKETESLKADVAFLSSPQALWPSCWTCLSL